MGKGYMGKVLLVDLTTRAIEEETIPDWVYETHLAGMGLGAYILYHRIPAGADPLFDLAPRPEPSLGEHFL